MGTYAELDRDGEEVAARLLSNGLTTRNTWQVDEGWLNDALLALGSLHDALGEAETSVSHGQGSRASTILRLDHFVTTELDTLGQSLELVFWDLDSRLGLAEERDDGLARVTANDRDDGLGWVALASDVLDEGLGSDDIECSDAKELLGVEDTLGLQDLSCDWDCGVDWV